MESPVNASTALVQVFAKPPVKGKVKTRLIPDIGESNATEIYRYCLNHALNLVRQSEIDYQLWLTEESEDRIFNGDSIFQQHGPDLGSRMFSAIDHGLRHIRPVAGVILIGSDCLDMSAQHLHQAIEALRTHDIVLLPTFDGGYALIGCRQIESGLFNKIIWGESEVLQQTLDNASALGYRVSLLETVRDIDTLQDLNHYAELRSLVTKN
jgi:rSAM/selenodomain-associated transferase 1